jgi:hypothetical protein
MLDELPLETTLYSLTDSPPEPPERRGSERHLTLLRVGSLTIGERRELCLIKNVSAGGMLVRVYCDVAPDTAVSIELKHGEPISGVARWTEDNCVGVTFDEPVDILALLSWSAEGPRPRIPRVAIGGIASLRQDGSIHRARAVNISQGGLKVECGAAIPVGADVVVSLPGLSPRAGTVRWADGGAYGINFNRVIALPELVARLRGERQRLRAAG